MAVFSPKPRLISFRISQNHYDRLQSMAEAEGAHSLSEFVRENVCGVIRNHEAAAHAGRIPRAARGAPPRPPGVEEADETGREMEILTGEVLALRREAEWLESVVRDLSARLNNARGRLAKPPQGEAPMAEDGPAAESLW